MTAQKIVDTLLEDVPADPDDPHTFLAHYRDAFERIGFYLIVRNGDPVWVWKGGHVGVEVLKYTMDNAAELDVPYAQAVRAGAVGGGYAVWAFKVSLKGKRATLSHKVVPNEDQAVAAAAQFQKELQ